MSNISFAQGAALSNAAYVNDPTIEGYTVIREYQDVTGTNRYVMYADSQDNIIVAFRGTGNLGGVIEDGIIGQSENTFGKGKVHTGFEGAYSMLRLDLQIGVQVAMMTHHGTLSMVGHSLGGALAVLATEDFADEYTLNQLMTFGAPAVGDQAFVDAIPSDIQYDRVVNGSDIVNASLNGTLGYAQGGNLVQLNHDSSALNAVGDHGMDRYIGGIATYDAAEDQRRQHEDEVAGVDNVDFLKIVEGWMRTLPTLKAMVGTVKAVQFAQLVRDQLVVDEEASQGAGRVIMVLKEGSLADAYAVAFGSKAVRLAHQVAVTGGFETAALTDAIATEILPKLEGAINTAIVDTGAGSLLAQGIAKGEKITGAVGRIIDELDAVLVAAKAKAVLALGEDAVEAYDVTKGFLMAGAVATGKVVYGIAEKLNYIAALVQTGVLAYEEIRSFKKIFTQQSVQKELGNEYREKVVDKYTTLSEQYLSGELDNETYEKMRAQLWSTRNMYITAMGTAMGKFQQSEADAVGNFGLLGFGLLQEFGEYLFDEPNTKNSIISSLNGVDYNKQLEEAFHLKFRATVDQYAAWDYTTSTPLDRVPAIELAKRIASGEATDDDFELLQVRTDFEANHAWLAASDKFGASPDLDLDSEAFSTYTEDSPLRKEKQWFIDDLRSRGKYTGTLAMSLDDLVLLEASLDKEDATTFTYNPSGEVQHRYVHPWHYSAASDPLYFIHREFRFMYLDGKTIHEIADLRETIYGITSANSGFYNELDDHPVTTVGTITVGGQTINAVDSEVDLVYG